MRDADDDDSLMMAGSVLAGTVPLDELRAELDRLEALQDEVTHRVGLLRAMLPADQFSLVWGLREAEEQLGLVVEELAERRLVEGLARCLPEHAPAIRAAARRLRAGAETT